MSKFNVGTTRPSGRSVITTETTPSGTTHEDAPGYAHDLKSELFLLAVTNFVGEDTFYESGTDRDARYADLIHKVAVADPRWTGDFLGWLRSEGNMRSASLVGALEAARAMVQAGIPGARGIVNSVLQRADEPGEAIAYWTSHYGRSIPKPVKRGIGDAAQRLYTEYSLLKYDTASHGVRFGDVIELTHPSPRAWLPAINEAWSESAERERREHLATALRGQAALFKYAIDRRHGRADETPDVLRTIRANADLRAAVADGRYGFLLDPEVLRRAGMTWEDALSLAGNKIPKAGLWEAMIPSMGYMALLRNLRNFEEAGISRATADLVCARLSDPEQVAKSRQFPYRFLSAYENMNGLRYAQALDDALTLSLRNLPALDGRTLVLVDTSGSMTQRAFSGKSTMTPAKAAAVFGVALAMANPGKVDLYGFATGVFEHPIKPGASLVNEIAKFVARTGEVGHGTNIGYSLARTMTPTHGAPNGRGHRRVFVISDMQSADEASGIGGIHFYGVNLGGYRHTVIPAGMPFRHEFGSLSDATFKTVPLIESGSSGVWPWMS